MLKISLGIVCIIGGVLFLRYNIKNPSKGSFSSNLNLKGYASSIMLIILGIYFILKELVKLGIISSD
jgi:uncharacterized membrane protein